MTVSPRKHSHSSAAVNSANWKSCSYANVTSAQPSVLTEEPASYDFTACESSALCGTEGFAGGCCVIMVSSIDDSQTGNYSKYHIKPTDSLSSQNAGIRNVKSGGAFTLPLCFKINYA